MSWLIVNWTNLGQHIHIFTQTHTIQMHTVHLKERHPLHSHTMLAYCTHMEHMAAWKHTQIFVLRAHAHSKGTHIDINLNESCVSEYEIIAFPPFPQPQAFTKSLSVLKKKKVCALTHMHTHTPVFIWHYKSFHGSLPQNALPIFNFPMAADEVVNCSKKDNTKER